MDEERKSSACGNTTKGAAREEAGTPRKGKSVGKEVEESGRERGSMP